MHGRTNLSRAIAKEKSVSQKLISLHAVMLCNFLENFNEMYFKDI